MKSGLGRIHVAVRWLVHLAHTAAPAHVRLVGMRERSRGKTAGLAVGLSLGGLTVVAGIAFIFIAQGLGRVR